MAQREHAVDVAAVPRVIRALDQIEILLRHALNYAKTVFPPAGSDRLALQRLRGRAVQHGAVDIEARAVARAVPAALGGVESNQAAEVGAAERYRTKRPVLTAEYPRLSEAVAHHSRLSGRNIRRRAPDGRDRSLADEVD